ncbi:coenzyme F420-0:L-glutamate ligase [Streptomyces sp. NPDC057552]|uniref:coenzyme F420-0:L-glutamate ligase n=1 Tax=Streptomyces sp. NPDC057552 TaxID=3350537 RepID=UPI00367FA8B2
MTPPTSAFSAFALEPFPALRSGDDLVAAAMRVLEQSAGALQDQDIVVVASKALSVVENRADCAARQEAGRAVVDVLDQDPAALVRDQYGRTGPEGCRCA